MFDSLLIANRGEIARRIQRTCRDLGITTVAVFSDADADAAFVHEADLAVNIGRSAPADSYLRGDAVIDAALATGAQAVHPGYGFLSERAAFASAVTDAGLVWIGPGPEAIAAMGSKIEAKSRMGAAGVPLLPSAELTGLDDAALEAAGEAIGYPLLVKASAGGGGRGMRIVMAPADLAGAVDAATREAASAFGDGTVYIERYVNPSRHVEVQILGDHTGHVIHVGERECSIQRRHQKIIEEAPSPSLDPGTRSALHAAAVQAGRAIGYTSAGTVEFLLAPGAQFFFLEVNTRLQVEHPVTEAVHGLDLVRMQLEIAAGAPLPEQVEIGPPRGHAIEARIYAEDPTAHFAPSTGTVHAFAVPGPVRVDAAIDATGTVSQHYDPMIAKVIAHAEHRDDAIGRLAGALARTELAGIDNNLALLVRTLRHPEFCAAQGADTSFLERHDPTDLGRPLVEASDRAIHLLAGALARQARHRTDAKVVPGVSSGYRNVFTRPQQVGFVTGPDRTEVTIGYRFSRGRLVGAWSDSEPLADPVLWSATPHEVDVSIGGIRRRFRVVWGDGGGVWVTGPAGTVAAEIVPRFIEPEATVDPGSLIATMPGTVRATPVPVGDAVGAGDVIVVMEAMKMELAVTAATAGILVELPVAVGDTVDAGTVLATIEPS